MSYLDRDVKHGEAHDNGRQDGAQSPVPEYPLAIGRILLRKIKVASLPSPITSDALAGLVPAENLGTNDIDLTNC